MNRRLIAAVDDMFFIAKIRAAAEHLGLKTKIARDEKAVLDALGEGQPATLIVDLHLRRYDPFALVRNLRADERFRGLQIIGFFSHVQTELQRRAMEAGFDLVLARSVFTRRLPEILQASNGD
jgi:chemosensory pili system protein ChpA (sensor histidine kinase/response regulator)